MPGGITNGPKFRGTWITYEAWLGCTTTCSWTARRRPTDRAGGRRGGGVSRTLLPAPSVADLRQARNFGLDLGFFIDAEHQRLFRQVQIEPDYIAGLVNEVRVGADFEGVDQGGVARLQMVHGELSVETDYDFARANGARMQRLPDRG